MSQKALILFLVALAARLFYYGFFPDRPVTVDDALSWDHIAQHVLEGRGFVGDDGRPDPVRPPLYPYFLAAVYGVFGHSYAAVKLIQIGLSALTSVLLYVTARLAFGPVIAFWSGLASALYPPLILYSTILGSETLYVFLLSATLWLLQQAYLSASVRAFARSGVLLGISNLCRSTLSFYPFFLIALSALMRRGKREWIGWLAFAALSFLAVLPWTARNYKAFGGFLLVNISAGQLFWVGTLGDTGGRYVGWDHPGYRQFEPYLDDPIGMERAYFRAGLENVRREPLLFAKLTVLKFLRQWFEPIGHTLLSQRSRPLGWALLFAHAGMVLLCWYGIWKSLPQREILLPYYALFIYFTIMHNIIAPMPRFRLPIEPYALLFAVFGLKQLTQRLVHD